MARLILRLLTAIVMVGFLLVPALATMVDTTSSSVSDPVTITSYRAQYDVDEDGTLQATETITADFPPMRHGIFRYWDLSDVGDSGVRYPPMDVSIRMDGDSVPVSRSWEQGRRFRIAKIGDPDNYLSRGEHTYTIKYRIDGVLASNPGRVADESSSWSGNDPNRSEFVWQVVAAGWSMPMTRSDITINLPHVTDRLECTIGDGRPCTVEGEGTTSLRITTDELSPNTPVLLRAAMDFPAPDRASVPWSIGWDRMLGSALGPLVIVLVISIGILVLGYALARSTLERKPGFPVLYEPPAGLGPVLTAFIKTEQIPRRALTATILHLAEQGHVELTDQGGTWTITSRLPEAQWDQLDPVARHVMSGLGLQVVGSHFSASGSVGSGEKLKSVQSALPGVARSWGTSNGATSLAAHEWLWRIAFIGAVGVVVFGTFLGATGLYLMPFAAFAVGSAGVLAPGVGSRRTQAGREIWSRAGGFHRFLSTDAAQDRFDFSGREELYTAYIPYAVAFDVADRWARKYETSTGQSAPMPLWYGAGAHTASTGFFGGGDAFASFEAAVSSSISAYNATQSASSSGGGGGGGGFSGGGGGGGGGGSW